ncbi:MAG: EFR1 family ferrodoxin [Candidatus Omnitrophica bacterium]|nr:EFR1 family ferrodoxin [Candidatus Omnitrophota bacterium]
MARTGKYAIICFSGTGNTQFVSDELRKRLEDEGYFCNIYHADRIWASCGRGPGFRGDRNLAAYRMRDLTSDADSVILSFPTYASDVPDPIKSLIDLMPAGNGKSVSVVSTVGLIGGDACLIPIRTLERRGYRPVYAGYVRMPNNLKVPPLDIFRIRNGKDLDRFYDSAGEKIDKISRILMEGKPSFEGAGLGSVLIGLVQRSSNKLMAELFRRGLEASDTCVGCGLCVSTCPAGNITRTGKKPVFGKRCCHCLRCYNFCPVEAIQFTKRTKDAAKYPRYRGFADWKPPRLYSAARTD